MSGPCAWSIKLSYCCNCLHDGEVCAPLLEGNGLTMTAMQSAPVDGRPSHLLSCSDSKRREPFRMSRVPFLGRDMKSPGGQTITSQLSHSKVVLQEGLAPLVLTSRPSGQDIIQVSLRLLVCHRGLFSLSAGGEDH